MGVEIERKFLVKNDSWRSSCQAKTRFMQGYMASRPEATVRVRLAGDTGYLTIKGERSNYTAAEFEYSIPAQDARYMLETMCTGFIIEKWRHIVRFGGKIWEVDEFSGANNGLVLAEIELESAAEQFERPDWLGIEVSDDSRYFNAALAQTPYTTWELKNEE